MANEQNNNGFTLPTATDAASVAQVVTNTIEQVPAELLPVKADTSSRDMLIGGAVLLVLFVLFFFLKNGYSNSLVAKKIPPGRANTAARWLFLLLASLSTAAVLLVVNATKFLSFLVLGPIGGVCLLALIFLVVYSR